MQELNEDRPVTTRLVAVIVACLLVQAPVALWAGRLQAQTDGMKSELTDLKTQGTIPAQRLENRVTAIEKELQLVGKQLDRIESKLDRMAEQGR
jgi:phage shock protein A